MCGIAGIIEKRHANVAGELLDMMGYIQHRGQDAAGIAVYGYGEIMILRVLSNNKKLLANLREIVEEHADILEEHISGHHGKAQYVEMKLDMREEDASDLYFAINKVDGLAVHSLGKGNRIYKDGGLLENLVGNQKIEMSETTTHGIGHVRMATESVEDLNAAHPFSSPFFPKLSMVHNGQVTNYYNIRRFLESKGAIFKTLNDSEAACHLIAYGLMKNDGDLQKALEYAYDKMDGAYCVIACTDTQLGFVKDKLGVKPLLVYEDDDIVLLGSEQIEFSVFSDDIFAEEMAPGEVRVWDL